MIWKPYRVKRQNRDKKLSQFQAKKVPNRGQNHPVFERLTKPGSFGNKGGNTIF